MPVYAGSRDSGDPLNKDERDRNIHADTYVYAAARYRSTRLHNIKVAKEAEKIFADDKARYAAELKRHDGLIAEYKSLYAAQKSQLAKIVSTRKKLFRTYLSYKKMNSSAADSFQKKSREYRAKYRDLKKHAKYNKQRVLTQQSLKDAFESLKPLKKAQLRAILGHVGGGVLVYDALRGLVGVKKGAVALERRMLLASAKNNLAKAHTLAVATTAKYGEMVTSSMPAFTNGVKPDITFDTTRFDAALRKYMMLTKKSLSDVCNEKAYWIARNAYRLTTEVPKTKITEQLLAGSEVNSSVPLAAILVNSRLGKEGSPGLKGAAMAKAARKVINARKAATKFLKSGWIPAIQKQAQIIGKPVTGVRRKGTAKGGAKPAISGWKTSATIWNSVQGGENSDPRVKAIITAGLEQGMNMEAASMEAYIAKKMDQAAKVSGL